MPRFMIERNFAERLEMTKEGTDRVNLINDEEGVEMDIDFPERRQAQDALSSRAPGRSKWQHDGMIFRPT